MSESTEIKIERAAAYGDGIFETVAVRQGQPRFWAAHLERLKVGCLRLGLVCPDDATLSARVQSTISDNRELADFATLRLVLSADNSPRGYARAGGGESKLSVELFAAEPLARRWVEQGVRTRICNLRLANQPALAGIKSLNRLEQVLARAEWDDSDIFEGLTFDTGGRLICGTMSNVFIVKNSQLLTPGITRCGVSGIMRARVLQRLQEAGIDTEVGDINRDDLQSASEVFLSNSQYGVLGVRQIDDRDYAIGELTRKVQALLAADGVPECLA